MKTEKRYSRVLPLTLTLISDQITLYTSTSINNWTVELSPKKNQGHQCPDKNLTAVRTASSLSMLGSSVNIGFNYMYMYLSKLNYTL